MAQPEKKENIELFRFRVRVHSSSNGGVAPVTAPLCHRYPMKETRSSRNNDASSLDAAGRGGGGGRVGGVVVGSSDGLQQTLGCVI